MKTSPPWTRQNKTSGPLTVNPKQTKLNINELVPPYEIISNKGQVIQRWKLKEQLHRRKVGKVKKKKTNKRKKRNASGQYIPLGIKLGEASFTSGNTVKLALRVTAPIYWL